MGTALSSSTSHMRHPASSDDRSTIVWASTETSIGYLSMAMSNLGVCYLELEDSALGLQERLEAELEKAFDSTLISTSVSEAQGAELAVMKSWLSALEDHVTNGAPLPDIPVDMHGTMFQEKVWRYLQETEPGDVLSYGELAAAIGNPTAVRAVGTACGANRIAILIPCHRAVRRDGSLGGYRWGLNRKRALLTCERAIKEGKRAIK